GDETSRKPRERLARRLCQYASHAVRLSAPFWARRAGALTHRFQRRLDDSRQPPANNVKPRLTNRQAILIAADGDGSRRINTTASKR
ncbi:MAG: hypothetical protein J0H60_16880, partial [Rhizobiales bacterium]|nr:hypothetical protein [Hyphomicrobiales bacterium]